MGDPPLLVLKDFLLHLVGMFELVLSVIFKSFSSDQE